LTGRPILPDPIRNTQVALLGYLGGYKSNETFAMCIENE